MNSSRISQARGSRGIKRLILLILTMVPALLVLGLLSITHDTAGTSGLASAQTFKLGFYYNQDDFTATAAAADDFATLLSQETELEVEAELFLCADEVSKRVGEGQLDVALLDHLIYIHGHDAYGYEAELAPVVRGSLGFRSQINVRASGNYTDIRGLQGTKFAFVSSTSWSGYFAPYIWISDTTGIKPEDFFGQVGFSGRHGQVIQDVYSGTVDGGATFEDARQGFTGELPDVLTVVNVLSYTDYVANDPWVFRVGLAPSEVQDLADGIIAVSATTAGQDALETILGLRPDEAAPIDDSDYDFTRRIVDVFGIQEPACHYINIPTVLKAGS